MKQDRVDTDPLFARLRQQADATTTWNDPADADMPSPRVWLAIQEANKKRKKRRAVWMFLGLASGLLFTLGWWCGVPGTSPQTIVSTHKEAVESIAQEQGLNSKNIQLSENQTSRVSFGQQAERQVPSFANSSPSTQKQPKPLLPTSDFGSDQQLSEPKPATEEGSGWHNPAMPTVGNTDLPILATPVDQVRPMQFLQHPRYPALFKNALAAPDLTLAVPKNVQIKDKFHKQVQLTLQTGLFLTALQLKAGTNGQLPNGRERAAFSWQQGLGVGLLLNPHWALETGLQFCTHHISATRQSSLIFKTNAERFDPLNQVYTGTVKQELQTSFGEVEMRYDINRIAGQPVVDQTEVKVAIETDERVRYLRVPVALRYRRHFGRALTCGLQAGTGINLLTGYRFQVAQSNTQLPEFRSINARSLTQARGLTQVLMDAQAGLSGQFALTPRWQLLLQVEARHGLQSMYRNAGFKSYPVAIGLQLGLTCQLTN